MKKRKQVIKLICNRCGKEQESNKEKSDKNWTCYGDENCDCGGEFKFKIIKNKL